MQIFLKKCRNLPSKFPGTIGDQINAQISALQTQNQSNQELINSLQTGNNGIKDAIDTTTATQEQLTSLTKESINNLHTFRSTFDQNILPLLGQTLDTFSTLTGQVEGMLNGVPATSKQINDMLDQLESGLSNTTALLDSTKECFKCRKRQTKYNSDGSECTDRLCYIPKTALS